MSVSLDDVGHIAALARLGLPPDRLEVTAAELNTILAHMDVLSKVPTDGVPEAVGTESGMPLRRDHGPPIPLLRSPDSFAPEQRDGFFLVPRLATHEDPEAAP